MDDQYDVVVIGSGAGGLTAAVALAQAGQSVLVCEQHEVAGGWCHSFTLNGYRFSPGVHYIGGLEEGGWLRNVYEGLGVSQDLEFCELNPDGYDHIFIGDEQFDIPKGREKFIKRLQERFLDEAEGVEAYFAALDGMMDGLRHLSKVHGVTKMVKALPDAASTLLWSRRTGMDMIEKYVSDPVLKAILAGQSGDHGLPPSEVSAFVHAGVTRHYLNGGYYPRGGGFAIPRAFVRALKRMGGEIRLETSVKRILIENEQAVGVELEDGTTVRAKSVISNADPHVTFEKLIGREHLDKKLLRRLDGVNYSTSSLSLFFAVDMDLKAAGLDSGNFWFYDHEDVDLLYRQGKSAHALEAQSPGMIFLTVTTLKDPSKMHKGHHTCEAFTFVSYDAFAQWAGESSGNRAADYEAMKEELSWKMFQALERRVPGISRHVVYWSLGTPLTNEHYINATEGNLYGIEKNRSQVGPLGFPIQSAIKGLYMVGASTMSHGVSGATSTGLTAARKILGCRTADLLQQNGPPLRIYPAEHIEEWPEELQQRIARGQKQVRMEQIS
ncbi:MAG: NAD(P)/FAD-dependent oxidoreductase [Candidatus Promineifilaceae bacterium]|nr:NAD(P)/FAD-dependent oxidoreductase [Candidatus Promineifilaceae bacterium]